MDYLILEKLNNKFKFNKLDLSFISSNFDIFYFYEDLSKCIHVIYFFRATLIHEHKYDIKSGCYLLKDESWKEINNIKAMSIFKKYIHI